MLNGTNSLITVPDSASLRLTSAMTLEAWVKPSVVSAAWTDVIYKGDDNYYLESATPSSSRPAIGALYGSTHVETFGTAALTVNVWAHLAATYDGTTIRLYVNGTQVATTARTGNITTSTNPLQIGGDSLYGQFFAGAVDDVRIYNRALTGVEVQTDMNTPVAGGGVPSPDLTLDEDARGELHAWAGGRDVYGYRHEQWERYDERAGDGGGHVAGGADGDGRERHGLELHAGDPDVHAQRRAGRGGELPGGDGDGDRGEHGAGERDEHGDGERRRRCERRQ